MQIGAVNYFYTRDHLGSIRELTDSTKAVQARYDYDSYGRRTKISGGMDADFGFTGHYQHIASGLTLAPYRAYDTDSGRWISRDPIAEAGGLNLYAYVNNRSINYIDPDGKSPAAIAGAIAGGVWGAVTGGMKGGVTGAISGGLGGAASGALMGFGVNPVAAGAVGGALSSLINQGLNGQDPCDKFSVAKTAVGAVTGGLGGLAGGMLPPGLGPELVTAFGAGSGAAAGETVIDTAQNLSKVGQEMKNQRQNQTNKLLNDAAN